MKIKLENNFVLFPQLNMSYPNAPKTLVLALRTGDIVWPFASAHSSVGDDTYNATYRMPDQAFDNQYGSRSQDGKLTTWKRIDLSSLTQGAASSRTFRITILERTMLRENDPVGDGTDNPSPEYELYDTYMHVDSSGGSGDRRIKTDYTAGVSTRIGSSILPGFHTGRFKFASNNYVEQQSKALNPSVMREGTFTVDPFMPFINISVYYEPIYPQDKNWTGRIGVTNMLVKISEIHN